MRRYIAPILPEGPHEEKEVCHFAHLDRLFVRDELLIPDIQPWMTLKCDLHSHTVFSDGLVWPDGRVYEAWQDGLDAVAITDHTNYHINREYLKDDLNASFRIARQAADDMEFLVIPGVEITDYKPFGHLNALFVEDVDRMECEDPMEALKEAERQEAFISWNHPGWPDGEVTLYPMHEQLLCENRIHGIEVMNYKEYYPMALQWCVDFGKAPMATADAHCSVHSMYRSALRPMTLVFSEEKSLKGIREALFAGRTAAFFDGKLAGLAQYLEPLVRSCLSVRTMRNHCLEVRNTSDIPFWVSADGHLSMLPECKTVILAPAEGGDWIFRNCFTGKDSFLTLSFSRSAAGLA